jgi:hypothetical protein
MFAFPGVAVYGALKNDMEGLTRFFAQARISKALAMGHALSCCHPIYWIRHNDLLYPKTIPVCFMFLKHIAYRNKTNVRM